MFGWLKNAASAVAKKATNFFNAEAQQDVAGVELNTPLNEEVRNNRGASESSEESFADINAQEEDENENDGTANFVSSAINRARASRTPSFIQRLLAKIRAMKDKVQSRIQARTLQNLGTRLFSGLGGEIGSLFRFLGIESKALEAGMHLLKAGEAAVQLAGLVIQTIKLVVETIVSAVKFMFGAIIEFFTGCKDSVVEMFTPENTEGGENTGVDPKVGAAAVLGLVGLAAGAAYVNRDSLPNVNETVEAAKEKADVVVTGVKEVVKEGMTHMFTMFTESEEAQQVQTHVRNAKASVEQAQAAFNNLTAKDVKTIAKRALFSHRRG